MINGARHLWKKPPCNKRGAFWECKTINAKEKPGIAGGAGAVWEYIKWDLKSKIGI